MSIIVEPDLVKRLDLIAVNWESVAPGTMREAIIDAKGEVEKLSALWIAETRENEKLQADLASTRSVYDFAALEAKIAELRAALKPFVTFGQAYPRPRIAVSTEDTIVVSARDYHITLADVDRATRALEQKEGNANV